ncbi:MAG TPA: hypothetical protein VHE12_02955 [bacterium]|nr:hypothetical protein [bacterium]
MRWGDLIIDSGKEWYLPEQILRGRVLYRDLAWLYGPFVPYWNALLLWVGGVHLHSLVASGILSIVLTVLPLHFLGRRLLGEGLAGLTVATFLCVLAFGFYISPHNYDYILPYTYAATYGMAFALWTLLFFARILEGEQDGPWAILALTLTALTRWELAAALAFSILLAAWDPAQRGKGPNRFRSALSFLLPSLGITVILYVLFFVLLVRGQGWTWEAIRTHLSPTSPFARSLMGLDLLRDNLLGLAVTLGLYAVFALFFFAGGRAAAGLRIETGQARSWGPVLVIAAVVAVPVALILENLFGPQAQFRCVPLICLYLAWGTLKRGRPDPKDNLWLATSLFAFLSLGRILLKASPEQYGFTLLVPGLLVYYGFFLKDLPGRFPEGRIRLFVKGGFLLVSGLFLAGHVGIASGWYAKCTFPVETPRGTLMCFPTEPAPGCAKLLQFLREDSQAGDSLAVFPEGAALNFLSGLPNPLTDYVCNPVDLMPSGAPKRVIDQLEANKVTYVVLLQRDTGEYGPASFGRDYAKDIMGYVFAHYSPIQQWGPFPYVTQFFGMVLLKRHSDQVIVR